MWGKVFWLSQGRILAFARHPAMSKETQWKQIFTSHFPKYNFTSSFISSHLYLLPISSDSFCFLYCCSLVTKSLSNSLQPYGLQHTRLPCPSPSPGVCSNSCPLKWWCHPTISSFVALFSSCLQSFPASGSFPIKLAPHIRQPKVLELQLQHQSFQLNIWGWFPFRLNGLTASYFKQNINLAISFPIYYFLPVITNKLSLFLSSGNLSTQIL